MVSGYSNLHTKRNDAVVVDISARLMSIQQLSNLPIKQQPLWKTICTQQAESNMTSRLTLAIQRKWMVVEDYSSEYLYSHHLSEG